MSKDKKPKLGDRAKRLIAAGKDPKAIVIKGLIEKDQKLRDGCVLIVLSMDQPYPIKTLPGTSIPVKRGVSVNYDATKLDQLPPGWSVVSKMKSTKSAGGES